MPNQSPASIIRGALLLSAVLLAGSVGQADPPKEAVYKGKPTSYWVARLTDPEVTNRREAVLAVSVLGKEAKDSVPELLKLLRDDDSVVRVGALDALAQIGLDAKGAVPLLLQALGDRDALYRAKAIAALGRVGVGQKGVPEALAKLVIDEPTSRLAASEALRQMGASAVSAIPTLIDNYSERDDATRSAVARLLPSLGPDAAPALATVLSDPNPSIRTPAAVAFRQFGKKAAGTLPEIKKLAAEAKDAATRVTAVDVLGDLGPDAVPALVSAMEKDENVQVRMTAIGSLGRLGPDAEIAIPALVQALKDRAVAREAANALARVGSKSVIPLLSSLNHQDPLVRGQVIGALAQIKSPDKEAVPTLIRLIKNGDETVRAGASRVVLNIGEVAAPLLVEALQDRDDDYSYVTLGQLGPKAKGVVPDLIKLLDSPSSQIRLRTARVLGVLGPTAREALPALERIADDENANVRVAVAAAIRKVSIR